MKITPVAESVIKNFGDMFYVPHILISIRNPGQSYYTIMDNKNRRATMILKFHDVDTAHEGMFDLFTEVQATKILEFVDKWKDSIKEIVVNCTAGFSRSPGVAAALSRIINGEDSDYFRKFRPNMLVYRTILDTYEKNLIKEKTND